MKERFGFSINKSKGIDLDNSGKDLFLYLSKREPDIQRCMSCGSCTATCTAGVFTNISFRKIILFAERGEEADAKEMAMKCMLCGKCLLICPRGINTRNILREIFNHI